MFSSSIPRVFEVILIIDILTATLDKFASDHAIFPAVRAAAAKGRHILDKYYSLTDDSIIYRVAMSISACFALRPLIYSFRHCSLAFHLLSLFSPLVIRISVFIATQSRSPFFKSQSKSGIIISINNTTGLYVGLSSSCITSRVHAIHYICFFFRAHIHILFYRRPTSHSFALRTSCFIH
ncbi:hypothetical protein K439DRAFT_948840 [Ramaria rubella]|nr:hypothetical protein K439DRAFT_948840 [Ramaria rubella]